MNTSLIFDEIAAEVERATAKFPTWPTDGLHAVAVVAEEMGELQKEVLQLTYEPHKSTPETVRNEAVQLAAMSIRFLMSLDRYEYMPQPQHSQNIVEPIDSLDNWDVGADGIPVKKGDHVCEEDGELIYLHSDGRTSSFT